MPLLPHMPSWSAQGQLCSSSDHKLHHIFPLNRLLAPHIITVALFHSWEELAVQIEILYMFNLYDKHYLFASMPCLQMCSYIHELSTKFHIFISSFLKIGHLVKKIKWKATQRHGVHRGTKRSYSCFRMESRLLKDALHLTDINHNYVCYTVYSPDSIPYTRSNNYRTLCMYKST